VVVDQGPARLSLVIPMAITYAAVGLLGQLTSNIHYGAVNQLIGFLGFAPVNWVGDPQNAFITICFWDIWQRTPFCSLVLLAGLTMVPVEEEETARLETKHWWTVLRYVQFPYLVPGLTAILILRTADTLKLFDMVFTLTRGGPGSATELISLMIQRVGFRGSDQGLASAQAIVLLALTIPALYPLFSIARSDRGGLYDRPGAGARYPRRLWSQPF
jgi:multiple sugar transport system permease protein